MRIEFEIPSQLNGKQLVDELKKENIEIEFLPNIENGLLVLHLSKGNPDKAKIVVSQHKAVFKEITLNEKLASVGLSLDELKAALA
jgi:hypothetical protein